MTLQPDEGEISFDLIMDDNMSFVEGAFRIGSKEWSVFIFSKRLVDQPLWIHSTWDSGISGIVFSVPAEMYLNMAAVEELMSKAIGCGSWLRVCSKKKKLENRDRPGTG